MIWIFGDSFSAKYSNVPVYFNGKTGICWYDMIGASTNYSTKGQGPYTSMKKLYHFVNNGEIKSDDKIIIMLSSQYRIPFDFLKDDIFKEYIVPKDDPENIPFNEDQDFDYLIDYWFIKNGYGWFTKSIERYTLGYKWIEFIEKLFAPEQIEYLNKHSDIILSTYLALKNDIDMVNVKNIYFLKTLAQLQKIKIICFLSYDIGTRKHIRYKDLNDEYFKLQDVILWNVCLQETIKRTEQIGLHLSLWPERLDNYRPNHLSYCNHKILSNIILNFFEKSNLDEKFHKNLFEPQKPGDFLYD